MVAPSSSGRTTIVPPTDKLTAEKVTMTHPAALVVNLTRLLGTLTKLADVVKSLRSSVLNVALESSHVPISAPARSGIDAASSSVPAIAMDRTPMIASLSFWETTSDGDQRGGPPAKPIEAHAANRRFGRFACVHSGARWNGKPVSNSSPWTKLQEAERAMDAELVIVPEVAPTRSEFGADAEPPVGKRQVVGVVAHQGPFIVRPRRQMP